MSGQVKNNNRLLIVLISIMSVVCVGVIGVLGVVVYKGYASESDANYTKEISLDESSASTIDKSGNAEIIDGAYYSQVGVFMSESLEFIELTFNDINMSNVNENNKNTLNKEINNFIIFMQTFNPNPITDADKLMHKNLMDAKYDIEQVAYHALQFVNTGDFTHRRLHKEYFDNFKIHVKTMRAIEEQYY